MVLFRRTPQNERDCHVLERKNNGKTSKLRNRIKNKHVYAVVAVTCVAALGCFFSQIRILSETPLRKEGKRTLSPCIPVPNIPFRSMQGEEKSVISKHYSLKEDGVEKSMCHGTVVEIGALDGLKMSNSYYFEYALNWTSVLIEALPYNYDRLVPNRPQAKKVHAAMCDGNDVEFVIGRTDATSGIAASMGKKHTRKWATTERIRVPCRTFRSVFEEHGVRHINVFFLDVEGGEYFALRTMDWEVSVDVWVIEFNPKDPTHHDDVRRLLNDHGYTLAWTHGKNEAYVPVESTPSLTLDKI